jgi:hypothetical protein
LAACCLFLVDNLFDDQARKLGHQGPQPGVFFKKNNHVRIQIVVETVIVRLNSRPGNWIIVAIERRIHIRHDKNSLQLNSAESGWLHNARRSPMIRRLNWDSTMVIAATMQQTGGDFIASQIDKSRAFKLTGDRITRRPKRGLGRESPQVTNRTAFNITRIARRATWRDCPGVHRRRFRGRRGQEAASCSLMPLSTGCGAQ